MAVQQAIYPGATTLERSSRAEVAEPQTVTLLATALPREAAEEMAEIVLSAAAKLIGPDSVAEIVSSKGTVVILTLRLTAATALRVGDPGLAPAMEAELFAALRALGHRRPSVAVVNAGPPMSWGNRAQDLWQKHIAELELQVRRLAEGTSFRSELAGLVENGEIRTVFQPIVTADGGVVLGYEALSRGPVGHPWERPDVLLEVAERAGFGALMQWEMVRLARLRAAARLDPIRHLLFVNAPDTKFWAQAPSEAASQSGNLWPWNRVVSEVSERTPIRNVPAVWEQRDQSRDIGVRYALDDVGAGYAGLAALALLAPDFLKVDMGIVRSCESDPAKRAVIVALIRYAEQTGARVIAEGVETGAEAEVLRDLGVELLQGFLIARPDELLAR